MSDKDERTLYVGNLAEEASDEILYELFLQGGPLENIVRPKDNDGRKRGFAFITFRHQVSVPYCIALFDHTSLFGREIRLDYRKANGQQNTYLDTLIAFKRRNATSVPIDSNRGNSSFSNSRENHFHNNNSPIVYPHNIMNRSLPNMFPMQNMFNGPIFNRNNMSRQSPYPMNPQMRGQFPLTPMMRQPWQNRNLFR